MSFIKILFGENNNVMHWAFMFSSYGTTAKLQLEKDNMLVTSPTRTTDTRSVNYTFPQVISCTESSRQA